MKERQGEKRRVSYTTKGKGTEIKDNKHVGKRSKGRTVKVKKAFGFRLEGAPNFLNH